MKKNLISMCRNLFVFTQHGYLNIYVYVSCEAQPHINLSKQLQKL